MSSINKNSEALNIQAKFFDFALMQLVYNHREGFEPLWTTDSWVKFLIWTALNCDSSGDKKKLEVFANALGHPLTSKMRRLFFERTIEDLGLKFLADPSDPQVLVMPIHESRLLNYEDVTKGLVQIGLMERVLKDKTSWQVLDAVFAIPWQDPLTNI